ncbi:TPA: hypothetical protein U1D09_000247 [Streptococcus suis]|nr:hypothetical protein [Streptococcus suis]
MTEKLYNFDNEVRVEHYNILVDNLLQNIKQLSLENTKLRFDLHALNKLAKDNWDEFESQKAEYESKIKELEGKE